MAKRETKDKTPNRYTTIIALKENVKRLSDARDAWKAETKNFSQVGLVPFILHLLDSYEQNRK